jgi:simple sugar transport system permease protein
MAAPLPTAHRPDALRSLGSVLLRYREISVAIVAIIVAAIFQANSSAFFSLDEMSVVLRDTGQFGVIACAEVLVMITGEIDLSAAKIFGFAPFVMWYFYHGFDLPVIFFSVHIPQTPLLLAFVLAVLSGVAIGFVNGFFTVKIGIPSLVTTLGTFFFLNGWTEYMSNSQQLTTPSAEPFSKIFGENVYTPASGFQLAYLSSITPFLWAALVVLLITYMLKKTVFGLHTIAVGSNIEGAKEIGVRVARVKITNFMLTGGLCALIGVIEAVRSTSTDPSAGDSSLTLSAIAAAVIGGTSLFGGSGTAIGALLGCFVIASLQNGLPLIGAQATVSDMIVGAAILIAMVLNIWLNQVRTRRG